MTGIYFIKCKFNNKVYIGSSVNIDARIKKHLWKLKGSKHENSHLQNTYNKYGVSSFKAGIIELCTEEILTQREQFYIKNNKRLLNIVLDDVTRPSLTREIREKISDTLTKKFQNEKYIPNSGNFSKGFVPWNKDKHYKSTEHLKVPKTISLKWIESRKKIKENNRNFILPSVDVYKGNVYLCSYRSTIDLYEDSLNDSFKLREYMVLRNKEGRNNIPPYALKSVNILYSAKTGRPYKGLNFKLKSPSI